MRAEIFHRGAFAMTRGRVLRIEDGRGILIQVREGSLWLTQEGDPQDRYLGPGASFRLDRDGVALAQATSHSVVALSPAQPQAAAGRDTAPARWQRWWQGLFAPRARPTTASL
jgi:hypothetical protein